MSWLAWWGGKKKCTKNIQGEWAVSILQKDRIPVIVYPPDRDGIRVHAGGSDRWKDVIQAISNRFVPKYESAYFRIRDGDDYQQPRYDDTMFQLYHEHQQHDRCLHVAYGFWERFGNDITRSDWILRFFIFLVISPWYLITYWKGIVVGGEPSKKQNVRGDGKHQNEQGGTGDSDKQR
ncbi:hypothetical protein NCS56_01128900 [Fusarium sp. Ph1]|nr:hypothetical protein NCS56_01128900 [Fusarium sp. Ph1]